MKFTAILVLSIWISGFIILISAERPEDRERERERDREREFSETGRERKDEREEKKVRDDVIIVGSKDPVVGNWNVTDKLGEICLRLDASIKMEISYEMKNGSMGKTMIVSNELTNVDGSRSICKNASHDVNETLALDFGADRRFLYFEFSRDKHITGDKNENKWQLYEIRFSFNYDPHQFPEAKETGKPETLRNDQPLNEIIVSSKDKSYGCTTSDPIKVNERFLITLNNFRTQPFLATPGFGQAEWCAKEQTSDLIPIIIGAALAALVIIVLIAYLIGRARARTTNYDNI